MFCCFSVWHSLACGGAFLWGPLYGRACLHSEHVLALCRPFVFAVDFPVVFSVRSPSVDRPLLPFSAMFNGRTNARKAKRLRSETSRLGAKRSWGRNVCNSVVARLFLAGIFANSAQQPCHELLAIESAIASSCCSYLLLWHAWTSSSRRRPPRLKENKRTLWYTAGLYAAAGKANTYNRR